MKVTNTNDRAYSLLLKNGKYDVLDAGETKDMDIAPAKVEEYRGKGFEIDGGGSRRAKAVKTEAAKPEPVESQSRVQTIEEATGPKE